MSDDLKRLYNTGHFSDVQIDHEDLDDGYKVIVRLKEKPIVGEITFSKIRYYNTRSLLSKIKTNDRFRGCLSFGILLSCSPGAITRCNPSIVFSWRCSVVTARFILCRLALAGFAGLIVTSEGLAETRLMSDPDGVVHRAAPAGRKRYCAVFDPEYGPGAGECRSPCRGGPGRRGVHDRAARGEGRFAGLRPKSGPFRKSATDPSASADVPAPSWLSRAKRFVAGLVLQSGEVTRAAVLTRVRRGDRLTSPADCAPGPPARPCARRRPFRPVRGSGDCRRPRTAVDFDPPVHRPGMHHQGAGLRIGQLFLDRARNTGNIPCARGTKAPVIRSRCRRSIITMSASLSPVRMSR